MAQTVSITLALYSRALKFTSGPLRQVMPTEIFLGFTQYIKPDTMINEAMTAYFHICCSSLNLFTNHPGIRRHIILAVEGVVRRNQEIAWILSRKPANNIGTGELKAKILQYFDSCLRLHNIYFNYCTTVKRQ
jgi:hypothetical protein